LYIYDKQLVDIFNNYTDKTFDEITAVKSKESFEKLRRDLKNANNTIYELGQENRILKNKIESLERDHISFRSKIANLIDKD
jgi:predicted RNase H-like nuclease (RuvC/YqgF family)